MLSEVKGKHTFVPCEYVAAAESLREGIKATTAAIHKKTQQDSSKAMPTLSSVKSLGVGFLPVSAEAPTPTIATPVATST